MTPSPSPRVVLGVAALSMALMTTEIVLTRMFSVIVWYHFAFFAISVALFGMGAAALAVHFFAGESGDARSERLAVAGAVGLAFGVVFADLVLIHVLPLMMAFPAFAGMGLWIAFGAAALPFFAGGLALTALVARHAAHARRIYFADLVGAGLGSALVVPLLDRVGAPLALLCSAALAAAAALIVSRAHARRAVLALGTVLALALSNGSTHLFNLRAGKGFLLDKAELMRWNAFSLVTVLPHVGFAGWGKSPRYDGPISEQKTLVIDLNAMTALVRFDGKLDDVRWVSHDLSAFVYRVKPRSDEVCIVGAGGGKDVLSALASGARSVHGAEINPIIVGDVVRGRFADFTGHLYERPDVRVTVEDGRSFVRRTQQSFDVLQLSMVDTSAATAAGAYALTENSLYTVDAFADFMDKLRPDGVLSVASVSLEGLAVGPRLVSIAHGALTRRGRAPSRSIVVLATPWLGLRTATMYDVLVRPDGWSAAEVQRVTSEADSLGFQVVYAPGVDSQAIGHDHDAVRTIARTDDPATLARTLASWSLDVSPTTDDRPFFFYQNRLRDLGAALFGATPEHLFGNGLTTIAKVAFIGTFMVLAFIGAPLLLRRRELAIEVGGAGWDLAYVSCLGFGFMLIEVPLIQRLALFLGDPTTTLSVVLLVILVGGGVGSRWLAPGVGSPRSALVKRILGVALLGAVLAFLAPRALLATQGGTLGLRVLVTAGLLAPLALLLGVPFPAGLEIVAARSPSRVPWLFGINSATSVLGSIGATLCSLHAGITVTLCVGIALYLVCAFVASRLTGKSPS